jgi:N-acetyl-1-D-myo-inositol-2-amino-2-deoxy-alpha-D-glucopyranoside deacetylase
MVAHASQIADEDVPAADFASAYGYEWFTRSGARGPLDALGNAHLLAPVPA